MFVDCSDEEKIFVESKAWTVSVLNAAEKDDVFPMSSSSEGKFEGMHLPACSASCQPSRALAPLHPVNKSLPTTE